MRRASLFTQLLTRCAPLRTLYPPLQQGVLHLELFIHFSTMLIFRPRKRFTTLASVRLTGLRRRCSLLSEKWGELLHILNLILMDSWTFITHLVYKYSKDTKSFIKCFSDNFRHLKHLNPFIFANFRSAAMDPNSLARGDERLHFENWSSKNKGNIERKERNNISCIYTGTWWQWHIMSRLEVA